MPLPVDVSGVHPLSQAVGGRWPGVDLSLELCQAEGFRGRPSGNFGPEHPVQSYYIGCAVHFISPSCGRQGRLFDRNNRDTFAGPERDKRYNVLRCNTLRQEVNVTFWSIEE
jgi:hypothetical protein